LSGRPVLYISPGFTDDLVNLDSDDSAEELKVLLAWSTRPEFVYEHRWASQDLVIWNQVATIHCRKPYPPAERRYMRQISLTLQDSERLVAAGWSAHRARQPASNRVARSTSDRSI
jgi:taurine dioxygenase/pentalenolactone F synthase